MRVRACMRVFFLWGGGEEAVSVCLSFDPQRVNVFEERNVRLVQEFTMD